MRGLHIELHTPLVLKLLETERLRVMAPTKAECFGKYGYCGWNSKLSEKEESSMGFAKGKLREGEQERRVLWWV